MGWLKRLDLWDVLTFTGLLGVGVGVSFEFGWPWGLIVVSVVCAGLGIVGSYR